jgi:hypothetical protein
MKSHKLLLAGGAAAVTPASAFIPRTPLADGASAGALSIRTRGADPIRRTVSDQPAA